jgi:thioredoxin-related protein
LKRAKREGKHLLIEWGGNWCSWCYKLHDVFQQDELVHPILIDEYELVLVDSTQNRELMESYGGKETRYAFPHLTILDAQGNVLTNQETGSLEVGPKHDPRAVAAFLKKWQSEPVNAEELLSATVQRAQNENKRIVLHVGNPYCRWCIVLTQFLADHEALLSPDYLDLRLDTVRMQHGQEVAARFLPTKCNGVPWFVILDASGKVLTTSMGPNGNCSYPLQPAAIDHFLSTLASTKQRMTNGDLRQIRTDLDAYRIAREEHEAAGSPPLETEGDVAVERDDIGLDVLLDAYRTRESKIHSLEVRWEEEIVERLANGKYDKYPRSWKLLLAGNKVRTEETGTATGSGNGKGVSNSTAFNGKVGKQLAQWAGATNSHGVIDNTDFSELLKVNTAILAPILFALRPTMVLGSRQLHRTPWIAEIGDLDGQRAFVLRRKAGDGGTYHESLYIDPTNFRIKRAFHESQSTVVRWDIEYRNVDGRDVPVAWKWCTSERNGRPYFARTARAVQVTINPEIAPSEFDLEFPIRTFVDDKVTGEMYVIGPAGKRIDVSRADLGRGATFDDIFNGRLRQKAPKK